MAVIVNRLTKIKHFFSIKTLKTGELADRFFERVYNLYKAPKIIILDKNMQFISTFWTILSKKLKIILKPLTAYYL